MKAVTQVLHILLILSASPTFGQFKIHHTTYGAPFGVPSHGSATYLSPFGANSLSSVLSALGIGPSSPTNQLTLTPTSATNNAAVPTFVISNASARNQRPTSQTLGQTTHTTNAAANGQTTQRASPTNSAGGGPQQIPSESAISNQIGSNPTGAATANTLPSRFAPPPSTNTVPITSNPGTETNAALEPQSANLLNSLFNNLLSQNPSTPFSSLSSQTPFIVILPQQDSGPNGGPQSAQVIMNVDPTRSSQSNFQQPSTGSDVRANNVISRVAQFMQANGLSTDLLRGSSSQGSGTPQIITVTPQVANQGGLSTFPQETPVLVLLDPNSLQNQAQSGTSALGSSTTGQSTQGNVGSRTSNQNLLNALTAFAQPFPVTTSRPTAIQQSNNAPGTSGAGTPQVNGLPPFPGQDPTLGASTANIAASGNPSSTGGASAAAAQNVPNASQAGATSSSSSSAGSPSRKTTQMIIPVIQDIRSLSRGAGGVYMYSFSIAGSDGITRHEVGEVAPGIRKISRTVSPAGIGRGTGARGGHSAKNGGVNGATSADIAASTATGAASGLVDPSGPGALADPFNVFGNYSYVDPNGQVFKLHYTHGPPSFMPQPPPEPLPPTAPHPFDFLLNKLTDLRVHHQLEPVRGATGASVPTGTGTIGTRGRTGTSTAVNGAAGIDATGNGAAGTGAIGNGAVGTGATGNGSGGTGGTGNGAAGTGATGNEAGGTGATGNGAAGTGVTGNGAAGTGAIGNGAAGTGTAGKSTTAANGSGSSAANEVVANEPGAASSPGNAGPNEILNAVEGAAVNGAQETAPAGAEATAAEAAPTAA